LPEREVLEINTLCGHGMVSFNFIRKMVEYVRLRRSTIKEAARTMGKCCKWLLQSPEVVLKDLKWMINGSNIVSATKF
jgi:hypothetical protein